nr:gibberellin 2-beta-dioxygenase 8-like [Tanacetum cinerariifolium]
NMRSEQVKAFKKPFHDKVNGQCELDFLAGSYRWGTPSATCLRQLAWSEAFHVPLSEISTIDGVTGLSDFLTILHQDHIGGLQLLKNGKWIAVNPKQETLIVIIGDLFQAWSNGTYKSVEHRVVANKLFERLRMALTASIAVQTSMSWAIDLHALDLSILIGVWHWGTIELPPLSEELLLLIPSFLLCILQNKGLKMKMKNEDDEDKDKIKGLIWVNNHIDNKKEKNEQV